ncbi:MAG TPA: MFS transporter [Polyangiales bacterium]|nr:MFS transporter [Polyangiales bacterium]
MSARDQKLHYAWVVAASIFVVLLCAAAVRATPSVLIVPLEREFGWSRALISSAVSLNLVLYGLVGPFAAAIMQSFGIRRTVLASLFVIACGVGLTTFIAAPWQLILFWGVLVGLGTGTTAMVLGATVVQRWFATQRGLVMGLLTASTATGQLLFLPLMAAWVEHRGWRSVSVLIASIVAALIPLVALLVRDRPSDLGLKPYGAAIDAPDPVEPTTRPLANAIGALARASQHRDFGCSPARSSSAARRRAVWSAAPAPAHSAPV